MAGKRLTPTVAGFFAGVGGIEKGFELAGFSPVWANELDAQASKTFRRNHGTLLLEEDINKVANETVPDVDVIAGGFPCQAFSVAGYRKGFEDDRGHVFFQLARIIEAKKPRVIFLENVKNLQGHDNGRTFQTIKETLEAFGYHLTWKVLNACEYGNIPQNRERIYIIGFLDSENYERYEWPSSIPLTRSISDIVDFDSKVDDRFYYTDRFPHYEILVKEMDDESTVYQWRRQYVRKNKSNLFPTLTANMGTGGHNVPLIKTRHGIRKLTPQECFAVQGFFDIKLGDDALSHYYKQAGNSVVVPVIERIAQQILKALK